MEVKCVVFTYKFTLSFKTTDMKNEVKTVKSKVKWRVYRMFVSPSNRKVLEIFTKLEKTKKNVC